MPVKVEKLLLTSGNRPFPFEFPSCSNLSYTVRIFLLFSSIVFNIKGLSSGIIASDVCVTPVFIVGKNFCGKIFTIIGIEPSRNIF
jgi:hypothetical protein